MSGSKQVLGWIRGLFSRPRPSGPQRKVRTFDHDDVLVGSDHVTVSEGGWRVSARDTVSAPLFEIDNPGVERCLLSYRASLRAEGVDGKAYLEMWCCMPGGDEYFSKGVHDPLQGDVPWTVREIPFWLKAGQRPAKLKLNVAIEGSGTVCIRDVELLLTPLK